MRGVMQQLQWRGVYLAPLTQIRTFVGLRSARRQRKINCIENAGRVAHNGNKGAPCCERLI